MGEIQLAEREKELLNVLGKHPEMSMKELFDHTQYKRVSTVVKKVDQFKKLGMLYGPYYNIDYGKLCKNPVRILFCILEFEKSSEAVISYLKMIEPLKTVYPVLSSYKELLIVLYLSSDNAEMEALLQLLKDNNIITDYIIRVCSHKILIESPNFFGDYTLDFANLVGPCTVPDMSLGHHDTDWNECDLAVLPYLREGYKSGKLIEIVKNERKLNRIWTYDEVNYSYKNMIKNKLIEKKYMVFPLPFDQCVDFNLFFKTEDEDMTQKIIYNLGRGARISREFIQCEDWAYIGFASHPQVLADLMYRLDTITEIKEKELYQLRSVAERESRLILPLVLKYFDIDSQTMKYPYAQYRENIKERIENES